MKRYVTGLLALAAVAWTWLVVLPWLGRLQAIEQHVSRQHAAGVNASAMFYSELECQQWLQR